MEPLSNIPEQPERIPTKYTRMNEWEIGKNITPLMISKVSGESVGEKPEFCDENGEVWSLVYIDHNNADIERKFNTKYDSIHRAVKAQKVERNRKYLLIYAPGPKGYKEWKFTPIE